MECFGETGEMAFWFGATFFSARCMYLWLLRHVLGFVLVWWFGSVYRLAVSEVFLVLQNETAGPLMRICGVRILTLIV